METAYVNLWELITTIARYQKDDLPNKDKCQTIQSIAAQSSGFGTELSLNIACTGTWTIEVFSHEPDSYGKVTMQITRSGRVTINRIKELETGLVDTHSVSF